MNAHDSVDCGFVRVPRSYLELPVSPGAKVLLLHLCAAANDRGESWHAYADIATLLGRSKSSIAAYVRELVDLGLVEAIEQKTANGFNYRRRLKLIQWHSFLALWKGFTAAKKSKDTKEKEGATEVDRAEFSVTQAPPEETDRGDFSVSKTERRVQPTERKDPTGPINKIPQNKTPGVPPEVWSDEDELAWKQFRPDDNDPISVVRGKPSAEIVEKLRRLEGYLRSEAQVMTPEQAREGAAERFKAFARRHKLECGQAALCEAAEALAGIADTSTAQDAAISALEALWKPYWRKLPSKSQVEEGLKKAALTAGPSRDLRIRINRISMRAWIAGMHVASAARRLTTPRQASGSGHLHSLSSVS